MKALPSALLVLSVACTVIAADPPEPHFRKITIDDKVQIGYAVTVADVDGDGKPDLVLVDKKQIAWYKNPGGSLAEAPAWPRYVIAENLTPRDNVCVAALSSDDDGKCELAVGADWDPGDTEHSGAVFYLVAPADRTQRWEPVKLPAEPTVHRMRWITVPSGKKALVVVPLHGRGNKNGEGAGVRIQAYFPPAGDPHGEWQTEVIDDGMHMTHNFAIDPVRGGVLVAGREGLVNVRPAAEAWKREPLDFVQQLGGADKGAGEIRFGHGRQTFLTTVEPMHGNALVCYFPPKNAGDSWRRQVLTDQLTEGHALACANFLGLDTDQVVIGWRGNPQNAKSIGVHLWTPLDPAGSKWRDSVIDADGMACEDLQVADLNGDGKLDIVASGRSTHNLVLYLNDAH